MEMRRATAEDEHLEGLDLVRRGRAVVSARRDLVLKAGQWIDLEYSDAAVKARRKVVNDAVNARPPKPISGLLPSVFKISGNLPASDTRLWRLGAVLIDVRAALESGSDPWMSARDPDREFHAAIGLVVGLLSHDANAGEYLEGTTQLASLKWVDESDIAASRTFVETWPSRKDRLRILRIALANLEIAESERTKAQEKDLSALADLPKQAPGSSVETEAPKAQEADSVARADQPKPVPGEEEAVPEQPALTNKEILVIRTMDQVDGSRLLSIAGIEQGMAKHERLAARTIGPIVKKLIEMDLAERPEGPRLGARLTRQGRIFAKKFAD